MSQIVGAPICIGVWTAAGASAGAYFGGLAGGKMGEDLGGDFGAWLADADALAQKEMFYNLLTSNGLNEGGVMEFIISWMENG